MRDLLGEARGDGRTRRIALFALGTRTDVAPAIVSTRTVVFRQCLVVSTVCTAATRSAPPVAFIAAVARVAAVPALPTAVFATRTLLLYCRQKCF